MQIACDHVEEQQFLISGQVEQFGLGAAPEKHGLQLGHCIQRCRPGTLDAPDHQRISVQRPTALRIGIPIGCDAVEALVEPHSRAFVGLALAATPVDLEQLQVRQRNAAAGAAQVRHQQVDGGIVVAERDEKVSLLLEVDLLVDTDGAIDVVLPGGHRRDRHLCRCRHGRRRDLRIQATMHRRHVIGPRRRRRRHRLLRWGARSRELRKPGLVAGRCGWCRAAVPPILAIRRLRPFAQAPGEPRGQRGQHRQCP